MARVALLLCYIVLVFLFLHINYIDCIDSDHDHDSNNNNIDNIDNNNNNENNNNDNNNDNKNDNTFLLYLAPSKVFAGRAVLMGNMHINESTYIAEDELIVTVDFNSISKSTLSNYVFTDHDDPSKALVVIGKGSFFNHLDPYLNVIWYHHHHHHHHHHHLIIIIIII